MIREGDRLVTIKAASVEKLGRILFTQTIIFHNKEFPNQRLNIEFGKREKEASRGEKMDTCSG